MLPGGPLPRGSGEQDGSVTNVAQALGDKLYVTVDGQGTPASMSMDLPYEVGRVFAWGFGRVSEAARKLPRAVGEIHSLSENRNAVVLGADKKLVPIHIHSTVFKAIDRYVCFPCHSAGRRCGC